MRVRKTIEDMRHLAARRDGLCLSGTYVRLSEHLEWQCAQGHRWRATAAAVQRGSWCPSCAREKRRDTLETMQAIAARHGGRCLSEAYAGCFAPLDWECTQGHRWKATPASVKHRTWCPHCASEERRHTLDTMRETACQRGGECLSEYYVNNMTPLRWRCAERHEWTATPGSILQGAWCAQCYYDSMRGSLAVMQAMAASRGGRCLSAQYVDAHRKLTWECHREHTWQAVPHSVKDGRWCPLCANLERSKKRSKRLKYDFEG